MASRQELLVRKPLLGSMLRVRANRASFSPFSRRWKNRPTRTGSLLMALPVNHPLHPPIIRPQGPPRLLSHLPHQIILPRVYLPSHRLQPSEAGPCLHYNWGHQQIRPLHPSRQMCRRLVPLAVPKMITHHKSPLAARIVGYLALPLDQQLSAPTTARPVVPACPLKSSLTYKSWSGHR